MAEHATELTGIAIVMMLAVLLGLAFIKMRQPAIVGYILTGMVLGPTGFELVSNTGSVTLLAELGVVMLLFLIGMELSLRAFISVLRPAIITAAGQITLALAVTFAFRSIFGWPIEARCAARLHRGDVVDRRRHEDARRDRRIAQPHRPHHDRRADRTGHRDCPDAAPGRVVR